MGTFYPGFNLIRIKLVTETVFQIEYLMWTFAYF